MDHHGNSPEAGSRAAEEFAAFPGTEAAQTAYSQAGLALASAADNIFALQRVLTEPMMSFAPWVLGRAVLEATATASWLLDPSAELTTRICRSMSLRLRQLQDQATFGRQAVKEKWGPPEQVRGVAGHVQGRVQALRADADKLGVVAKVDRNGRLIGFGEGVPSATALAERFGEGATYRILSGLTHGAFWAQLALAVRKSQGDRPAVEQHMTPQGVLFLVIKSTDWFAKPVWEYFRYSGWDSAPLVSEFERAYDGLGVKRDGRFWVV